MLRRFVILPLKALKLKLTPLHKQVFDFLVVGSGGTGQTAFMEISKASGYSINDVSDADGLKHLFSPPKWVRQDANLRVIFLERDITQAIASLERRTWLYEHIAKLNCVYGLYLPKKYARRVLAKLMVKQKRYWIEPNCYKMIVVSSSNFSIDSVNKIISSLKQL